jgi:UDP-glucuronate 4-epimerase
MKKDKVLVTGIAGFIGFHLVNKLIQEDYDIIGLDNINEYYDINLKYERLLQLGFIKSNIKEKILIPSTLFPNCQFIKCDLAEHDYIVKFLVEQKFDYVINLAAQAGVRYSIDFPRAYTHSNIDGFLSILEGCRHSEVKHLVYASSSSVYGMNGSLPFSEKDPTEHPLALYGATKKANEMMAHSYSNLFKLPTTGLRFFTVYGPWGRPDMALFLFADAILNNKEINVFNNGEMTRDFTYVGDIVESIYRLISKAASPNFNWDSKNPDISSSLAPYKIFNIGNSSPIKLMTYIETLENFLCKKAKYNFMPMQSGDVLATYANTTSLENYINYKPSTSIEEGISKFVYWYKDYFNII